jgi:broad specificity phosphatase PhoE
VPADRLRPLLASTAGALGYYLRMAELFLVRHAQAAFGTDDYDRLTDLGHRQARWLGEYFSDRDMHFDRVLTGSLRRHRETVDGIAEGGARIAVVQVDERLDEYDPERLVMAHLAAIHGERAELPALGADPQAARREHFRLLRDALTAWTLGQVDASVHRTFQQFQEDAYQAFERARMPEPSEALRVLVVSSGGPISSILAHHLQMPAASFVALNLQVRNSGFCELRFNAAGAQLVSFNNVPHLDTLDRRGFITFS